MRKRELRAVSTLQITAVLILGATLLRGQPSRLHSDRAAEEALPSETDASTPAIPTTAKGDVNEVHEVKTRRAQLDPVRIREALSALNNLLREYQHSGDRQAEANVRGAIANSYNALHEQQRSTEELQAELGIWRELGNRKGEALTLAHMGDVYRGWGFPEQANRYYRDALAIYPQTDKSGYAATLNNLGLTYFSLHDKKKCLENLTEALASYRALGDRRGEALTMSNLGTTYNYLANDPEKALGMFQEAVTRLELLDDERSEANALDNMGVVWLNLHKPEMANLSFQHAIALFHAVGDPQGEAAARRHMEAGAETGR